MTKRRDVYMNHMQQVIHYAAPRELALEGARRFGKTDGVAAPRMYAITHSLPQATCLWLGVSKAQLFAKTAPGTLSALRRFFGFVEGIHYGWGRPPKGTPDPILKPQKWDNVIWFANGTIWPLISLAQTASANSYSACSVLGDECKFMPKAKIDAEVMPALSGVTHPLGDRRFTEINPFYKSVTWLSDASLTMKGNWLSKLEENLKKTIEDGPFKGKTYQWVQDELTRYAEDVIWCNELLRNAKATGHSVQVLPPEEIERIKALAESIMNHEGGFKILPNHGHHINKDTITRLLTYGLITEEDAPLLYDHEYLITKEQHFRIMQLDNMLGSDKKPSRYAAYINKLRCSAECHFRASSLDNLDVLGKDYILQQKRLLPPLVFAVSILNMRLTKSSDGFYSNLDIENVHGYIPEDCPAINKSFKKKVASGVLGNQRINREYESPDFDELQNIKDCTLDGDVVDGLPLYLGFDYNANINWVVSAQLYKRDGVDAMNVLSSMYVKNERKLRELMTDWAHYYEPHRQKCKTVYVFYDTTAKQRGYAIAGAEDFKDCIISTLRKFQWDVVGIYMGVPMAHEMKYKIINEGLAGVTYPAIRINRLNNEALIIALENCDVLMGYGHGGFRKDKSGEKLTESKAQAAGKELSVPYEYRCDATDAFDQLYLGIKFHLNRLVGMCMPMKR